MNFNEIYDKHTKNDLFLSFFFKLLIRLEINPHYVTHAKRQRTKYYVFGNQGIDKPITFCEPGQQCSGFFIAFNVSHYNFYMR